MPAVPPATFITPALFARPRNLPTRRLSPPSHHTPSFNLPPHARSFESYREGNRFNHERRTAPRAITNRSRDTQIPKPVKQRISLTNALCIINIASLDTCGLLIRSGCVRVNGVVVKDERSRLDRALDVVVVNGVEYGTVEQVEMGVGRGGEANEWELLPRAQKDRYRPGEGYGPEAYQKYSRRVDRGFYSRRQYQAGK